MVAVYLHRQVASVNKFNPWGKKETTLLHPNATEGMLIFFRSLLNFEKAYNSRRMSCGYVITGLK